ncbi:MAG: RNA polymerase sigma factor [Solirubrobacterales bacterium]
MATDGVAETIAARIATRGEPGPQGRTAERQERRLIRAAQEGSEEALETLYRRHWPLAYRAAYLVVHDSAAAEDIAQEAFLAAVRALDRFDRRRPFGPWLNRIVVNRAIDWARARALRREAAVDPDSDLVHGMERPAPGSSHPYSEETLAALASLSPEHRAVVVLRYLLDCTPGEIAQMLELPRGTVNSRLRRALDRLKASLGETRE